MSLQLKQTKIRPGLPEHRAPADRPFNAIRSYLEDQATLAETVNRLAEPIDSYYEREFDDLVDQSLYFTWATFNRIMVQIPHENSAGHIKLAEILMGLSERPSPSDEARIMETELNGRLWVDLPDYEPEPRGGWGDAAGTAHSLLAHDRRLDPGFTPDYYGIREEWTRCNAFVARLATKGCKALHCELYAIITLRAALEEELHADEVWMNVPAAVVWMMYAGHWLFDNQRELGAAPEGGEPQHEGAAHGGTLWQGRTGFCIDRWAFWKERFRVIMEREDVDEETRSWAERAMRAMEELQTAS